MDSNVTTNEGITDNIHGNNTNNSSKRIIVIKIILVTPLVEILFVAIVG